MTVDKRTADMDAHHYWRQFPIRVYWDTPKEIVGTVLHLGEQRAKDGYLSVLTLQLEDGTRVEMLVTQTRLLAELVDKKPAVGDKVKITYTGEAAKAAPGMNPSKEFTVVVKRASPLPGARTETARGSADSENGPRAGSS